MTAMQIIREAQKDGVTLTLSPVGTIKARGDQTAVNRWLSVIREHKPEITEALKVGAGENFTHSPQTVPPKLTKGGCGGFVSTVQGVHVNILASNEPEKVGTGDTATASRWWLIHYPDRDPVEVACCPEATHAEILERHPDAVAAEPFTPTIRQPSAPLTASEESAIRTWLALIEETDPATIAEVIGQCQRDADARDYFTGRYHQTDADGGGE